jgi:amidase
LKPESIWEIENSHTLSSLAIYNAEIVRANWYRALRKLFDAYDFLLLPAAQVFPFAAEQHWPAAIAGRTMDSYHRWMEVVIGPTMAGLPAISVPAGFDVQGLPMGLQIIGPPRADRQVLEASALYQDLMPWIDALPASLTTA